MSSAELRVVRPSVCLLLAAVLTCLAALWSTTGWATITQGDFSIFGDLDTREAGRWGEGSARGGTLTTGLSESSPVLTAGKAPTETGGPFGFNHWDLVEARQIANIRPDYHFVKNYRLLNRIDLPLLADADFFAIYRGWYDAYPDIKPRGRAETARDWNDYTHHQKVDEFTRDDLREFYGQLNFTENFSMRIGKQQVIWSEADALSGTDVTNPQDYRYHWNHFESAEDLRENLRMVKFNYLLPDFLKTANNDLEFFWIPGDWENGSLIVNTTTDQRSPYVAPVALNAGSYENQMGEPYRSQLFGDNGAAPMTTLGHLYTWLFDLHTIYYENKPSNSIANSEFGGRYSTLLPVGNGLQTSLIWLYEARSDKEGFCLTCPIPAGATSLYKLGGPPGSYLLFNVWDYGPPLLPTNIAPGTIRVPVQIEWVRQNYFDMTGTYYDKDLTDMVYRYDIGYDPKIGSAFFCGQKSPSGVVSKTYLDDSCTRWTQETRWIVAADRPTYIPWLSKQHTFLTFQNTVTWYPDRHTNAVPYFPTDVGKLREVGDFLFVAATNWLMNGQWTAQNVFEWDVDNTCFAVTSTNSYRYSENVRFGLNAVWYLGKSGRFSDPYALSRAQRDNELEFRFAYEI